MYWGKGEKWSERILGERESRDGGIERHKQQRYEIWIRELLCTLACSERADHADRDFRCRSRSHIFYRRILERSAQIPYKALLSGFETIALQVGLFCAFIFTTRSTYAWGKDWCSHLWSVPTDKTVRLCFLHSDSVRQATFKNLKINNLQLTLWKSKSATLKLYFS